MWVNLQKRLKKLLEFYQHNIEKRWVHQNKFDALYYFWKNFQLGYYLKERAEILNEYNYHLITERKEGNYNETKKRKATSTFI